MNILRYLAAPFFLTTVLFVGCTVDNVEPTEGDDNALSFGLDQQTFTNPKVSIGGYSNLPIRALDTSAVKFCKDQGLGQLLVRHTEFASMYEMAEVYSENGPWEVAIAGPGFIFHAYVISSVTCRKTVLQCQEECFNSIDPISNPSDMDSCLAVCSAG